MSIFRITFIAILSAVLIGSGLWIGQSINLLPVEASSNAPFYDQLFRVLFSVGTILFLLIFSMLIFSLIRFRRRKWDGGDGAGLQSNLILEFVWTLVPGIVVLIVGLYSYDIYDRMGGMLPLVSHHGNHELVNDAAIEGLEVENVKASEGVPKIWGGIGPNVLSKDDKQLTVEVTAMQFAFIFKYPDQNIISGELHLPIGRPVELRMEGKDVIHAFWVPEFRLKQDIIPGQTTVLNFIATRRGDYPIICAELCGPYHGGMRSRVIVDEANVFDQWLVSNTPVSNGSSKI
uniref:Cytochrome c oxidase subunit 2 n=1 Tax=Paulinella chromatophora TaxID=39717 RepID=B1X5E2_PAUCH|nr:possible cytochrome c oxidase subunit II [Paulinella chromatophora]ACB43161.1 possible cytochrome c oxidase subunit II [Paulinella chromatophora]